MACGARGASGRLLPYIAPAMARTFLKMNGLGNDFVVVESRTQPFTPTADEVRAIADRASGIGCDQVIAIDPSAKADAGMRIWNADGGEVEACGNATRCVGWILMQASGRDAASIETAAGVLHARKGEGTTVSVDMGEPGLDWTQIPLSQQSDTMRLDVAIAAAEQAGLGVPGAVNMGNPHVVFFVDDALAAPVNSVGPIIEHDPLFPEAVNVGFAQIRSRDDIRLKVWERGAGQTLACGTGACAALVAAHRRGLANRRAKVEMDGGVLEIEWRESDGHVIMTGPASFDFTGTLP
jgi:diaminopimelate epimerase